MKLIVGLGNPGKEYTNTRHNAGFLILDTFVQSQGWSEFHFDKNHIADLLEISYQGQKIICIKPQTFMNRSGFSVASIAHFYKIDPSDILVIHDEIDFPLTKIQLKFGGSPAGHNGLKDIIAKLGTSHFWRLRIGVDRPINKDHIADYVLTKFNQEEVDKVDNCWNEIQTKILTFLDT